MSTVTTDHHGLQILAAVQAPDGYASWRRVAEASRSLLREGFLPLAAWSVGWVVVDQLVSWVLTIVSFGVLTPVVQAAWTAAQANCFFGAMLLLLSYMRGDVPSLDARPETWQMLAAGFRQGRVYALGVGSAAFMAGILTITVCTGLAFLLFIPGVGPAAITTGILVVSALINVVQYFTMAFMADDPTARVLTALGRAMKLIARHPLMTMGIMVPAWLVDNAGDYTVILTALFQPVCLCLTAAAFVQLTRLERNQDLLGRDDSPERLLAT